MSYLYRPETFSKNPNRIGTQTHKGEFYETFTKPMTRHDLYNVLKYHQDYISVDNVDEGEYEDDKVLTVSASLFHNPTVLFLINLDLIEGHIYVRVYNPYTLVEVMDTNREAVLLGFLTSIIYNGV